MGLRGVIRQVLKEISMRNGARDVERLFRTLKELRFLTTVTLDRGRTVTWFHSDLDGHLYEVIVSPVQAAVYDVPAELRPPVNTTEPFSSNDISEHIRKNMGLDLHGIALIKDTHKYYDFQLMFDLRRITKNAFEEKLKSKVMVVPYRFSLLPTEAVDKVVLRYIKT